MVILLLLGIFVGLPAAEILTFVEVGSHIGGLATVATTVGTALAGMILFRVQGFHIVKRARQTLDSGSMPFQDILDGLGLLSAGLLLFLPGFITDIAGFLLFIPPLRIYLLAIALQGFLRRDHVSSTGGPRGDHWSTSVIDSDYENVSDRPDDPVRITDNNPDDPKTPENRL